MNVFTNIILVRYEGFTNIILVQYEGCDQNNINKI